MTAKHPRIQTTAVYATTNGRYMGNFVSDGVPPEEGKVVPLDALVIVKDDNGEWPAEVHNKVIDWAIAFSSWESNITALLDALAQEEPQ